MPKYQQFFNDLAWLRSYLRQPVIMKSAKRSIGDSIKNNRTLTINQTIRYLRKEGKVSFARQIGVVYEFLKADIKVNIRKSTKRTDAMDLTELVSSYRTLVMNKRKHRQIIGQLINKAS